MGQSDLKELQKYETELDHSVQRLWDISSKEMKAVNNALAELGFSPTQQLDLDDDE